MTISYMAIPQNRLTLGATQLENTLISATVTRIENGFDSARIIIPDTSYYPSTVTEGTTVQLEVKESGGSYTTLFVGTVRFITADISDSNTLTLQCRSIGAGLADMLVAAEYGVQSTNGLDTITEIITDATYGIIPNYVQKIFGGSASNYSFDTSNVTTITDSIPYISFPYKPAKNCLNDLVDLITAYKAGTAGPHWIVTYSGGTNYLRLKLLTADQTGWTKYYGGSQANATLTYGVDYSKINLEKMAAEANYIVYYGAWQRPSNGDYWTEGLASAWGEPQGSVGNITTNHIVGSQAIYGVSLINPSGPIQIQYPSAHDAAWNFSGFTDFNTPNLNFYVYYSLTNDTHLIIRLYTSAGNYYQATTQVSGSPVEYLEPPYQQWQHYSIPVGPYFNSQDQNTSWTAHGSPDWGEINYIEFYVADGEVYASEPPTDYYFAIDGLHFGDADVCRVAALSSYSGIIVKQKLITDNVGKDDSLVASNDSGLMAKLSYAEFLRAKTNSRVGTVVTPMIKDILPGQWLYIQSTDYRAPKIVHSIIPVSKTSWSYTSTIDITDDIINGRSRLRYEDLNKQYEAIRPEWQDRQASTLKAGGVDWRIARLVKTY